MTRIVASVLVVLAGLPGIACAQERTRNQGVWGPRLRLTPYAGVSPTATRTENWLVYLNGAPESSTYKVHLGTGPAAGLQLELRLVERFGLVGGVMVMSRGRTTEVSMEGTRYERIGSDLLLAKAALSVRLRENVSALQFRSISGSFYVGPALVEERPRTDGIVSALFLEPIRHRAVNFGFEAEMPIGWNVLALQAGLEDFVMWWNYAEYARRFDAENASGPAPVFTETAISSNPSHLLLLRGGLVLRF